MNKLEQLIMSHEGLRLFPYKCPAGKMTIGVGRNIEQNGISRDEAFYLLRNDIDRCKRELEHFDWFLDCNAARQGVLIEMCFNMGLPKVLRFKKMIKALEKKDYNEASEQMLDSKWAHQVGPSRAMNMVHRMSSGAY